VTRTARTTGKLEDRKAKITSTASVVDTGVNDIGSKFATGVGHKN